jgi:hypothetical protein
MSYSDFNIGSKGTGKDQITGFSMLELPVHGVSNPANLWVRVTGIAHAFRDDPPIPEDWARGTLFAVTDTVFEPTDIVIAACATAGVGRMDNDDDSDLYGAAIDEIAAVQLSGGVLTIIVNAAYLGDIQIWTFTFSADLLILRPTLLDPPPRGSDRLKDVFKDSASEFPSHVGLAHKEQRH